MRILKIVGKTLMFCGLASILLFTYTFHIEPHRLVLKEYELESKSFQSDNVENLTIIQISDLEISRHYKEYELERIVRKINAKKPDFVFFTGDLFENYSSYQPTKEVIQALKNIKAVYGKYSIWGNNDYGGGAVRVYESIMEQSGFDVLRNEGVNVVLSNGKKIFIGGLDDKLLGKPNIQDVIRQLDESSQFKILLIHEPNMVDFLQSDQFDLVLAGHSHGGQVNVSFLRKMFHMESTYQKGFYKPEHIPNTLVYVNSGLGTSRIPARFLVPPEIASFQIEV